MSGDIFQDELSAIYAISNEAIMRDAKVVEPTAIVAAKAKFTKCIIATSALPYPASGAATAECMTWHALTMTGIIATLNSKMDDIHNDYITARTLIQTERNLRQERIKDRRDLSLSHETARNDLQLALISQDLDLCLARVNGN